MMCPETEDFAKCLHTMRNPARETPTPSQHEVLFHQGLLRPFGREFVSLSTRALSGTPYCKPIEIESASPSMKPESVEPSFAILMKISPGLPSSYIPTMM